MGEPTEAEVQAEIDLLREMTPKIRQRDAFGGDNRAKIEAQILALEERMDEDEAYAEFEDPDDLDGTYNIAACAVDAVEWLEGRGRGEPPSKGWEALVQQ